MIQRHCFTIILWIFLQACYSNLSSALLTRSSTFTYPLKQGNNNVGTRKNEFFAKMEKVNRGGGSGKRIVVGGTGGDQKQESSWINTLNPNFVRKEINHQFEMRVAADPNFVQKSFVELVFAIAMQFAAELGKRGTRNILPEMDFVFAGIMTAMIGKYYSMWRLARTISEDVEGMSGNGGSQIGTWRSRVPTNAFQRTLLDGKTKPNIWQRLASFITPMPSLFKAGFLASLLGYGFTAFLIALRTLLLPSYEAATVNVNILHACLYTGTFMAVVSNVRYQVLQGLIEPLLIERLFAKSPGLRTTMISLVRLGNGFLGSYLAIAGMKMFGVQKLK